MQISSRVGDRQAGRQARFPRASPLQPWEPRREADLDSGWIPLSAAIERARASKLVPEGQAIPRVIALARGMEVRSRIALQVNRHEGQPTPNVTMNESHWRDLEKFDSDWIDTGNAEWDDGYAWRGIEIHGGDLAIALSTIRRASGRNLQPVANSKTTIRCADTDEDTNSDWLRITEAVRLLHLFFNDALAEQEPAPWIERPRNTVQQVESGTTLPHRKTARTSLTMRRALLSGDLTAHLVNDDRAHPLPGWAWENAYAAENAFNFDWLPLNPLLGHGLGDYEDWRCFVSRAEFQAWLARPDIVEIGDLPTLPAPHDHSARPEELSCREPPNRPFVELTQALTWIAFGVSLSGDELAFMEPCRFGPFADSGSPDDLRAAMARFADQASAGNIRVRGRYVANYSDHSAASRADTAYLSDTQLRDFACFDSLHGGLEPGAGLAWETDVLEQALNGRNDGWRDVEVCRADVMRVFNRKDDTVLALTQPIPASLPDIGSVMGLDEALSWLAHNRPSYDYQVWADGAGEIQIRDPSGEVVEPAEDGSPPQSIEDLRQASRKLHEVLRDGSLATYVASEGGSPLQVPRAYWNSVNPESLHHVYRGMTPDDRGAECPVLLSRKAFDEWRNGGLHASGEESDAKGRAPAVKKGRPPSEEEILAKADEMKARGLDGRTLAKMMRHEPGFEHVATTEVRELIRGRYKPGGRPRRKGA